MDTWTPDWHELQGFVDEETSRITHVPFGLQCVEGNLCSSPQNVTWNHGSTNNVPAGIPFVGFVNWELKSYI